MLGPVAQESVVDSALLRSIFRPFKPAFLYTSCTQCPARNVPHYFWVARDTGAIANAPKTILPRNPPGFRLLQAKFFSRRHQCDRFANAPIARFRSFSHMNPNDEVTSVGGCQLPKELPRFGICLQRFGDVDRQVGDYWSWRVGYVRGCRF